MFAGISWEASRGPLGSSFEASWGPFWSLFWASWGPLRASWGPLGASWGPLWASWEFLGRKARIFGSWSFSWAPLGAVLRPSWAVLGASWAVLAPSWAVLGASWEPLGPSWGGLRGLLDRLQRREGLKIAYAKTYVVLKEFYDLDHVGPPWQCSWRSLGTSWRLLGPSWGHSGRLGMIFRRLEALLDHLGGFVGGLLARHGPSWARKNHAGRCGKPQRHAANPKRFGNVGSGPLKDSSGLRIGAQTPRQRT